MFKNKLITTLGAGGIAVLGMIAGTAFIASAQTSPTTAVHSCSWARGMD